MLITVVKSINLVSAHDMRQYCILYIWQISFALATVAIATMKTTTACFRHLSNHLLKTKLILYIKKNATNVKILLGADRISSILCKHSNYTFGLKVKYTHITFLRLRSQHKILFDILWYCLFQISKTLFIDTVKVYNHKYLWSSQHSLTKIPSETNKKSFNQYLSKNQ